MGNLEEKIALVDNNVLSHDPDNCSTNSIAKNWIENEFETDWNYYVALRQTFLALKQKLLKDRGSESYKTTEI